jgi:hypothetical protein
MTFMKDDEFFLLMDLEPADGIMKGIPVDPDNLLRLRDAGIQTAVKYLDWGAIETKKGKYDWSASDAYVEKMHNAGMKVLLCTYISPPAFFPDEWYTHFAGGRDPAVPAYPNDAFGKPQKINTLSLWHAEAQAYSDAFIRKAIKHYSSDDTQLYNAQLTVGETMYHNEPAWFEDVALQAFKDYSHQDRQPFPNDPITEEWLRKTYLDTLIRQQQIFQEQGFGELWSSTHRLIAYFSGLYGNGCKWIDDMYEAYLSNFPTSQLNVIQYTYFPHGSSYWQMELNDMRLYGINIWGGAEYCEGLTPHTPIALAQGLRGLIISPIHPFTGHPQLEPWMVDAISTANGQFKANRGLS